MDWRSEMHYEPFLHYPDWVRIENTEPYKRCVTCGLQAPLQPTDQPSLLREG